MRYSGIRKASKYLSQPQYHVEFQKEKKEKVRPGKYFNFLWEAKNFPKLVRTPNHRSKKVREHQVGSIPKLDQSNQTHHTNLSILMKTKCDILSMFQRHGGSFVINHPMAFQISVTGSSCERAALLFMSLTRASPPSDVFLVVHFIVLYHGSLSDTSL